MKRHLTPFVALFAIALLATSPAEAQKKEKPKAKPPATKSAEAKPAHKPAPPPITEDSIKPLPEEPIPDNPLPHEGALFKLPHRIESPDLILVEVLEALPGRPITGEHLVRPDGKISLGFYGDVHVAGLTTEQAKTKIILHLRQHLTGLALGLEVFRETDGTLPPLPPAGTLAFDGLEPPVEDELPPPGGPKAPAEIHAVVPPLTGPPRRIDPNEQGTKRIEEAKQKVAEHRPAIAKQKAEMAKRPAAPTDPPLDATGLSHVYVNVAPIDSTHVFVDVAAYNSSVYYALGHFGSPGRLPHTGNETVLDAVQFAGGFRGTDPRVWLHRPARGGKPKRDIKIDMVAIYRGDKTANLQLFPGDRLVAYSKGEEPEIEKKAK